MVATETMVATRVVATGQEETLVDLPAMIAEVAMDAMAAVMAMKNALRSVREVVSVVVARKPTCNGGNKDNSRCGVCGKEGVLKVLSSEF